jgi:hypothetical protein
MSSHFLFGFCKFRTLNHKLPIECRRWQNIARNMRFCNLCNQNEIGSWNTNSLTVFEKNILTLTLENDQVPPH